MAYKPEIQYVGQFYVQGSEALAPRKPEKKKKTFLAKPQHEKLSRIYIDPVATVGILVAVVMLVVLVMGAVHLQGMWDDHYAMQEYLSELKRENAALEHNYRIGYDVEEVQKLALALGLVPMEEVENRSLRITIPEPQPETTFWDNVVWFFEGLFA